MKVKEVVLVDISSKRKGILKNLERQVILQDRHIGWCHAIPLEASPTEKELLHDCYKVRILDSRPGGREVELHYHDLNTLLTLEPEENYPLPKVRK